jgi:hypothetical protein
MRPVCARKAAAFALVLVLCMAGLGGVAGHSPAATNSFTFVAFGDANQSGTSTPPAPFLKVMDAIHDSGAALGVSSGDFINDLPDSAGSSFSSYAANETPHVGIPVWRTSGDNDHLNDSTRLAAWNATFASLPTAADPHRRWFSADHDGVHFVFLGTDVGGRLGYIGYTGETSSSNSTEAVWLVKDLQAQPQPATIVVLMHEPLVFGKSSGAYATTRASEATALEALFAKYGVDMVIAGHTHVFRRTMIGGTPYLQVPACASTSHLTFGSATDGGVVPRLTSSEAGWETSSSYHGFLKVHFDAGARTLALTVEKVDSATGVASDAQDQSKNGNLLGGTFPDVSATAAAPRLVSFTPSAGPVGTKVTVTGANLSGATGAAFNGTSAAIFSVVNDTRVIVQVPAGATTGTITIATPAGIGTSATDFTVTAPAKPHIVRLSPSRGRRGATVTITGTGFGARRATSFVNVGNAKCKKYYSWSRTRIKCKVPAKAKSGRRLVTVTTAAGTGNGRPFRVTR